MNIRQANQTDIAQLLNLEQQVIEFERSYNSSLKSKNATYYDLPNLLASDNSHLLVAEASDEIIGTGYAQIRDSKESLAHETHSYLGFMFVSPEHRGKGVNQKIIDRLIAWSQSKGVDTLYLNVYSKNASATKAYEKAGFEPCLLEMKLCL